MSCCGSKAAPQIPPTVLVPDDWKIPGGMELILKTVIIGDSGVGKSKMLQRLIKDSYTEGGNSTIGVDFETFPIIWNGHDVNIIMWDTAGQERFEATTTSYFRGMHAVLLVYDITNEDSFQNIKKWLSKADAQERHFQLIVIGCKLDRSDEGLELVDASRLPELLDGRSHLHCHVSSKQNIGFDKLKEHINTAAVAIMRKRREDAYMRNQQKLAQMK